MNQLAVPRLLSDHMVLQHGRPVHLWGTDAPGRIVRASIAAACVETETDETGKWSMFLPPMRPDRKPHTLQISDDIGESIRIQDVLIGDVFYAGGQSNMDLMMERVKDRYPEEIAAVSEKPEPCIRCFKIAEETHYAGELSDHHTGVWWSAEKDTILSFSALGYFFALHYYRMTGIPVAFLHASLGGSLISCWMSREMLSEATEAAPHGYTTFLREADRYAGEKYIATQLARNERVAADWNLTLDQDEEMNRDFKFRGLPAGSLFIPGIFRDDPLLDGFIGKLSIRKKFSLTEEMLRVAGEGRVRLLLGTLVDRDEVYLNGQKVGETGYQYPPRKYEIPIDTLKEGENEIEIRLIVEHGEGRFTPGKLFALICEKDGTVTIRTKKDREILEGPVVWQVDLTGEWKYQAYTQMPPMPEIDFISWHPTGLYNAMTAPCHPYTISGIFWYQGESNADKEDDYGDELLRMIRGYRKRWATASVPEKRAEASEEEQTEVLPFYCVQLPNFTVDLTEEESWPRIREMQRQCLSEPSCYLIAAIDLGADNDLHPHDKEPLGYRLALAAAHEKYHGKEEYTGPEAEGIEVLSGGAFRIRLRHADGLHSEDRGAGDEILDFVGVTADGLRIPFSAVILPEERAIELTPGELSDETDGTEGAEEADRTVTEIRYIDSNTYHGALICNQAGLPMAPFRMKTGT